MLYIIWNLPILPGKHNENCSCTVLKHQLLWSQAQEQDIYTLGNYRLKLKKRYIYTFVYNMKELSLKVLFWKPREEVHIYKTKWVHMCKYKIPFTQQICSNSHVKVGYILIQQCIDNVKNIRGNWQCQFPNKFVTKPMRKLGTSLPPNTSFCSITNHRRLRPPLKNVVWYCILGSMCSTEDAG
jgi:hypothetical protein